MSCRAADVDESCDDKKIFSSDNNQRSITEKSQPLVKFEKTSVQCGESANDLSSTNRMKSEKSSRNSSTISDVHKNSRCPFFSGSSTPLTNVGKSMLYESKVKTISTEVPNRPRTRIHFYTPEAEARYRKIVKGLKREPEIKSSETSRNCSSERERKLSLEMTTELPVTPMKIEDEVVSPLGLIPEEGSNLFSGMSFILTCGSRDVIDPHQIETMQSTADAENEEQWTRRPFSMARLTEQLKAGGGKVYREFELVPPEQYKNTMLITNIPNLSAKSLLCLSVGIAPYNHQWIIRCCNENKIVNPAEDQLPAGWSLIKESYIEMFQRPSLKPFSSETLPFVVVIPMHPEKPQFVSLWGMICQNAGAVVLVVNYRSDDFIEGTVVLTHSLCPSWLIERAESWGIPIVSTRWAIQCLIEGQICSFDAHPSFDYEYAKES